MVLQQVRFAGEISEFAAGTALSTTGLFDEIGSVQNKSGWGVDFVTKTWDGEWISWEMKANSSQLNKGKDGRAGQQDGPTKYTNQKLGEAISGYRNWKNEDESVKEFSERILDEQRDYNLENGRKRDRFDGFVVRTKYILDNHKLKTTVNDWKNRK
jgi:hypothetical protein